MMPFCSCRSLLHLLYDKYYFLPLAACAVYVTALQMSMNSNPWCVCVGRWVEEGSVATRVQLTGVQEPRQQAQCPKEPKRFFE